MSLIKVTFQPDNSAVFVPAGTTLKDAAVLAGILTDFPCGAQGKCGKCKVWVKEGLFRPNLAEKKLLSLNELKKNIRLACQAKVKSDTVVFVPKKSQVNRKKLLISPIYKKVKVKRKFRPNYGLALDIGTTSVSGVLIDLNTNRELSVVSETNTQLVYGADVISRINHAVSNDNGLSDLQQKIIGVINRIIDRLSIESRINKTDINDVTVVGNTAMQHFLMGFSVKGLAALPFEPTCKDHINVKAKRLKIKVNPEADIYIFPCIAGFIGGDTVGMILALNLHRNKGVNLAIDIGTNGEIVLGSKEKLLCTSTAAGPAFEGAHISCGMRAVESAIESVYVSNEGVFCRTIGDVSAEGICGSGLIDIAAELVKFGIVDKMGRFIDKNIGLAPALLNLLIQRNGQSAFLIAEDKIKNKKIFLSQKDIRELQLAKGAIYSGIQILKTELGVNNINIKRLFISGTFGNYIDKKNAQVIGLMPDMPLEKVVFVGNAALAGAKLALVSPGTRREIETIIKKVEYIELSVRPDFNSEFVKSMQFRSC
ncbi:MAG: DUF4445 domain-containing protein [Elusimicrobia bacterium]|nr:DUF4445 domain-containing protein [Elusimicrobiota bacterium]